MQSILNLKIKALILSGLVLTGGFFSCPASAAKFVLTYEQQKFEVAQETLASWRQKTVLPKTSNLIKPQVNLSDLAVSYFRLVSQDPESAAAAYNYHPAAVYKYITELAKTLDIPSVEPELTILNKRAIKFTPPQNGLMTDIYTSTQNALAALQNNQESASLVVSKSEPRTRLSDLNDLGITELVARGESAFKGSPKNRRHNIQIGVEKMTGIILSPGEEFSFNKFLGPVEEDQGFLPELVIKKDGTVPELGGGLCQVSSTTFRAAMAAGLPIKERKNHAYAVQYYSPQGTDATIYPGSVDLRFINDTPGSLLIWPYLKDKDHLNFDFYGTKDTREVALSKPVQYDRKEDGSMKATWERRVVKNGVEKKDTFKSIYQSPALFHKEEKFVSASTTPSVPALEQNAGSLQIPTPKQP